MFHIGLLALIGGIAIQQAFHDGGAFELSEGATASLADDGVVFNRTRGILAPERPPALQLALSRFDPYRRQEGYAPDRFSRLEAMMDNSSSPVESALDRAHGIEIDGVELFHALPHGLALNLEIEGMGTRSIHLQADSPRNASREVATSDGHTIRFAIETEHELDSLTGTGSLSVRKLEGGQSQEVRTGGSFSFGERQAKLVSVTRWAGYTYQRNPGLGLVWLGIGLVIAGSASLIWPSLVAQCGSEEPGIAGYIDGRWGSEIMVARWLDWPGQKEERS